MDRERLERIKELLDRALDLSPAERDAFLDRECDDPKMRREIDLLLAQDEPDDTEFGETEAGTEGVLGFAARSGENDVGRVIGPYTLKRRIGAGGMGVVYEAHQTEPVERTVALKLIKLGMDSAEVVERFDTERRALALMSHPNVARVLDAGTDERGRPYFVMEYIDGVPITDYCDRERLETRERVELMIQVCQGVLHAHQKGIIHRDLKPTNILVEVQDGRPIPRIIDFGVAKAIEKPLNEREIFTQLGQMIGTPEYMSPEQAEMKAAQDIDTRTDVYSLGVVMYELLSGALPFDPKDLRSAGYDEIRRRIREDTPAKPSTRISGLGERSSQVAEARHTDPGRLARTCRGDLDWITMKAMDKDRGRRYSSVSDLATDLERYLNNEPVTAGPPSASYRVKKFVRRYRTAVAVAALFLITLVAGIVGTTTGMVRAQAAEGEARREATTSKRIADFMIGLFKVSDPSEARGNTITAREILDRGVEDIRTSLDGEPEVQGRLLHTMGEVYRGLGLYGDSVELLESAVDRRRGVHGDVSLETAESLSILGGALIRRREWDRAKVVLEEAVATQAMLLPAGDAARGPALNNLASATYGSGDVEGARVRFREVLALRQAALGDDHLDVAKVWNNLGNVSLTLKEYDEAGECFESALAIREVALGEDHPLVPRTLNNLAKVRRLQGRYDEAEALVDRAVAIQERVLGPDHHELANSLRNRAALHEARGDLVAARADLERALAIDRAVFGDDHGIVKRTSAALARL